MGAYDKVPEEKQGPWMEIFVVSDTVTLKAR
jgi:hypothetical protein